MVEPECLHPKEVLAHLNSLGYHDISPHQLKEFIHDLKKLIKYEQKQNCDDVKSSKFHSCECSPPESESSSDQLSCNETYDSSCPSHCSSSDRSNRRNRLKIDQYNKQASGRGVRDVTQRAQPSFIRPWQLLSHRDWCGRSKKNLDPVDLYHQYKDTWSRLKIPGETSHSQLRWVVRSKMLGQEPQPRVPT